MPQGENTLKGRMFSYSLTSHTSKKAIESQIICSVAHSFPVLFQDPHSAESSGRNWISPCPEASSVQLPVTNTPVSSPQLDVTLFIEF